MIYIEDTIVEIEAGSVDDQTPRVRVMRVEWTQNHARDGGIVPKVVVSFV